MSSFTDPLRVEIEQGETQGRGLALLTQGFTYEVGALGSGDLVNVPAGFETDFCSTPRCVRWLFPSFDRGAKASVIHDWLWTARPRTRSRAEIDRIFREALEVLGVPAWRRWTMWAAVRLQAIATGDR